MKAYIISDGEYETTIYKMLSRQVATFFEERGFEIERKIIQKGELHFCLGCYSCWTKKPGECVIDDSMEQINRTFNGSDVVVYLSPIIFGQYSPNIKNAIDRWLPNVLPLFVKKPDATTGHPARYLSNPKMIIVGYGDAVSKEDSRLFKNVVKHRKDVEVFVFSGHQDNISINLDDLKLERMKG